MYSIVLRLKNSNSLASVPLPSSRIFLAVLRSTRIPASDAIAYVGEAFSCLFYVINRRTGSQLYFATLRDP